MPRAGGYIVDREWHCWFSVFFFFLFLCVCVWREREIVLREYTREGVGVCYYGNFRSAVLKVALGD